MNKQTINEQYNEFIQGFSLATGLDKSEAIEQWGAHSRQLSDSERNDVEQGGFKQGEAEGREFAKLYPDCTNHGE